MRGLGVEKGEPLGRDGEEIVLLPFALIGEGRLVDGTREGDDGLPKLGILDGIAAYLEA